MKISRAGFLKVCAAAVVGAGAHAQSLIGDVLLEPAAGGTLPPAAGTFDWPRASAALFRPHLTTAFHAAAADGSPAALILDRVVEHRCDPGIEQFSLIFHGTTAGMGDGVYTVRHAALGEFDIFLAQVRAPDDRPSYEACFSRPVGRSARA